ncbi:response regulator [Ramlibacter ginsenosidimutans]|uniref:histidine kinase n=1 Tax=Ramlibacter ginsenosidimutans TaxID=502333 RepID=A0A934TWC4_9BURK|nr:response regulator [Ramlibacter ginsenosidimutans]
MTTSQPRDPPPSSPRPLARPPGRRRWACVAAHWRAWLACALLLLFADGLFAAQPTPHARAGVIDLTAPGALGTGRALEGEWGFAWERFLDPAANEPAPAFAPVPGVWNELTADGKPRGPDGYGTYTLLVRCPEGRQLALSVPPQRTAMRMYVNGQLVAVQGLPGTRADEAQPAIGRRAVLTDSFACPLHVTLHLSNWSHRAGGVIRAPVAGPIEQLSQDAQQRFALDTLLVGGYLVLSISPLFFFLVRPKEKAPLYFGLFALAQTVYTDMTGERLLLQLTTGPQTAWELYLHTEYSAWLVSMGLFALLIDKLFPRTMRAGLLRLLVGACGFGLVFVLLTPARVYSRYVLYGQLLGVSIALYSAWCLARAARQGRPDAGVVLGGLACLGVVLTVNMVQLSGDMTQRGITAVGLLAFVLTPGIVLLRRLGRALNVEEQRSAGEREKVDLLVRATHAGILDWDYTRNLTRYSDRLLEIMGYPPGTDTSEWPRFFRHIAPEDRERVQESFMTQLRDRSVRGGEMKHQPLEYRLLRQDGSVVWVHAEAISLRGADGRTLRYICSFLDITDHRAVAEGLERQNAALAENARLREDVERMSRHDLKTPLNSIIGVARLIREDARVPQEQRELLGIAERAGYRMLEMVNLSLDLSRMELGTYDFRPQAVNLLDVIDRVQLDLQPMAQAAQVRVRLETPPHAPMYARAEELLCYSILANLLKNAIEASPRNGVVTLRLQGGDPIRVQVHNAGAVPQPIVTRFFDKYVTAGKSGGTGLGTYSARLMARVQNGELEMQTDAAGTLLTLSLRALGDEQLPPARRAQPALAPAPRADGSDFPASRLLLVDDDEYNRLLLMRYLPSPPFTVETAANGAAAVEAVARQWPDFVLIDMEMPVMNGLEAVAWIRAREREAGRKRCAIVMMSSNDDPESIRRGLAAGSDRYLAKPFTREALLALLHLLAQGGPPLPAQALLPEAAPQGPPLTPEAAVRVDPELLHEVPAFLASRRKMVDAMAEALASGQREQLHAVAHRAAGGLALFGFQWAAWQCRGISARAAVGDAAELGADIARLRRHLDQVQVQ